MHSYTWQAVPTEEIADDISRQMIAGRNEMVVRWKFKKGALAARHSHPHEQIVMMESGRLRFAVGDEEKTLRMGDIVVVPPSVPHEAEALEDTVVIDIFSPPREDFLSNDPPVYMTR
jgi:quercetin dioxygenase-like cupin family protein